jgi:hypothetical protein
MLGSTIRGSCQGFKRDEGSNASFAKKGETRNG